MREDLQVLVTAIGIQARYLATQSTALHEAVQKSESAGTQMGPEIGILAARCTKAHSLLQAAVNELDRKARELRATAIHV
ncbi:hypothetical protein [Actinomadura rubrisoli]|uniref:Uncharacterized protein n=1 Tax=Actinomadura rubrisoli TaxID=2530368 RepID=A0A4V2YVT3_9ACTN|nr:hypothetical protein [Actinomadura rubrisoli]TDD82687.1 hypothetical protein E1298_22360 [Actinomadura rubrisoli]